MAQTQLQIINRVQRRLRETETASVATTDYSMLLGDFLNDVIGEMNDDHDWTQLDVEEEVSVVAGTIDYTLSSAVPNDAVLRFLGNSPLVYMFDDASDELGEAMILVNKQYMQACRYADSQSTSADPIYFALVPDNTADTMTLQIYPEPEETRTIKLQFWVKSPELEVDGTDDTTDIWIPQQPLYLGTLFLALNERGEELGEPGGVAETRYNKSKDSAIYTDMIIRGRTNEYESHRD